MCAAIQQATSWVCYRSSCLCSVNPTLLCVCCCVGCRWLLAASARRRRHHHQPQQQQQPRPRRPQAPRVLVGVVPPRLLVTHQWTALALLPASQRHHRCGLSRPHFALMSVQPVSYTVLSPAGGWRCAHADPVCLSVWPWPGGASSASSASAARQAYCCLPADMACRVHCPCPPR